MALCCLLAVAATADSASAQEAANQAGVAGEPARRFASVWRIRGDISASTGETGPVRRLQAGDPVYVGERVRADASAEVVLKTEDAGLLAVRPGGVFIAERFAAEGKPTDNLTLRLVVGSVRVISGWIARINRPEYRVVTQTTTIGIRGTDHEPYVLTADLAATMSQPAGTYDKVNRGGTTLDVNGNKLDIEAGKVGFVRAPRVATTRALMTLLLPVLLDKVPDFYVPGEFDDELDLLSQSADDNAVAQLEERRKAPAGSTMPQAAAGPASTGGATAMVAPATAAATAGAQDSSRGNICGASGVARGWLAQLDGAIVRRNAPAIQRLFAPQVVVQATVRDKDGNATTVDVSRDEFARSAGSAVKGLSDYQQRRVSIDAQPESAGACDRIIVKSVVIEQGKQNGAAYRFESTEEFTLERRAGRWLATRAATTQR